MAQFAGAVRWFNNAKGYGFLGCEDDGDTFVHSSSVKSQGYKSLSKKDEVEHEVAEGETAAQANRPGQVKK